MHKILFYNKVYFMPLHVSSTCVHHQEVKIALHSLWYHHTYRWPSRSQVERGLQSSLDLCTRRSRLKLCRSISSSLCIFLHSLVTSSLLGPNTIPNNLFSNPRSSLNVSDQVSHPHKTKLSTQSSKLHLTTLHRAERNAIPVHAWAHL